MRKYMRMKHAGVKGRYAVGAGECRQLVTGNRPTRHAPPPLRLSPLAAADNLLVPTSSGPVGLGQPFDLGRAYLR